MATSQIPAFKAALFARLQADSDLDGVQVTYGDPHPRAADQDWVWLGDARGQQEPWVMGRRRRREDWNQEVMVSCVRTDRNDPQALTERAFELVAVIEDSLRAWGEVAGTKFDGLAVFAQVVETELKERVSREQRESLVTVTISAYQILN